MVARGRQGGGRRGLTRGGLPSSTRGGGNAGSSPATYRDGTSGGAFDGARAGWHGSVGVARRLPDDLAPLVLLDEQQIRAAKIGMAALGIMFLSLYLVADYI